jgi:hypothetical protein
MRAAQESSTGRGWAYAGALLGAGVSVAANVAHSYVPPAAAGPGWSPHTGAVVGAVFWPVALLVAIEVLARVPWPNAARWTVVRFGGLGPVALVAAVVSYRHLSGLLSYYGEDGITSTVGPLAVDGLMVMATGALLATGTATAVRVASQRRRDGAHLGDVTPRPPSTEPARKPATSSESKPATAAKQAARPATSRVSTVDTAARVAALRKDGLTTGQIAAQLGVSERTVRRQAAKHLAHENTDVSSTEGVSA